MMHIGVDIGGTFTDVFAISAGAFFTAKVPTTSPDPSEGALAALALAVQHVDGAAIESVRHGTTVATNAVIERTVALVGLLTTDGFRDVIEIGRQTRPNLYDLRFDSGWVPVPRELRTCIVEKTAADGTIRQSPDREAVLAAGHRLVDAGAQALAVCFMNAYVNDANELLAAGWLREEFPELVVVLSSEAAQEIREYERFSTTVLNAGLRSMVSRYLSRMQDSVGRLGDGQSLRVMQSSGGLASVREVVRRPTVTLLSGPAAGVLGATTISAAVGCDNVVAIDMGGTSADIAFAPHGCPRHRTTRYIDGVPVLGTSLDVDAIGAGGGSIAWVDAGTRLRVGPSSAGSLPGPASYGLGGDQPTVTDAHVVVGNLPDGLSLGGTVTLDRQAAVDVIGRHIGDRLGLPVEAAAWAILDVVNTNMELAIRRTAVSRGIDLRDYTLVAYGGAGPLHAAALAENLGIHSVVVPTDAGTLAAMGLLASDIRTEFSRSWLGLLGPEALADLSAVADDLQRQAREWQLGEGISDPVELTWIGDMRYVGQGHTIQVGLPARDWDVSSLAISSSEFERLHEQINGFRLHGSSIEVVNLRLQFVRSYGIDAAELLHRPAAAAGGLHDATTPLVDAGGQRQNVPLLGLSDLVPGEASKGPVVLLGGSSTCVVPYGMSYELATSGAAVLLTLEQ